MCYPRESHNKGLQKETPPTQNNATGTKRKRTAAQKKPAIAKTRTLAPPKYPVTVPENTLPAQNDPSITVRQPQIPRTGLDNSPVKDLATELRLIVIQLELQNLQKVTIVPKSLLQGDVDAPAADPGGPSLVFATKSALSKTCQTLHTEYAGELESQVTQCKVPNLALHVRDFDFTPFTYELFSTFKDSRREFFNARAKAITIHLTLTPSFFARGEGERGRIV